ncbi:hypothetical protein [Amycolatopsis sp. NBRC 101858]|uniref:hypothetical protein n=1 Tax=Amycolatopsis sp. NBRC 101858 TaxID=3032200 RepID=UPI00255247A9|nr:hypothetical protein [Amycolatopsis sp. NBRC 101858]
MENTVCALRRLAPGAALRPVPPELAVLARALRECSPAELAVRCPAAVVRVVLAAQLRALDRAMTGVFGPEVRGPEAARLVRAARFSGRRRGALLGRLRAEPGLLAAALGWAEAVGARLLAAELRGVPPAPDGEDGRRAAELAVAALLPRPEPGEGGREVLPRRSPAGSGFLDVRSVRVGERGFRVGIRADPPVELVRDGGSLAVQALWWNGLGRVSDDLGHEYLIVGKDPDGTGMVRHWCHPRPAPGARVLRLESAGYRGERLSLAPAAAGTSAEVLVKLELTVRLGG